MSELERAANPTIEEAIKYLEGMIFTQDFHPSTLRAKRVNTMAIEALREQAERSKGCEWCKALSFNPDIGGCQLVFFKSKKHPKGEHAISVSVFDEYGEEQEPVLVQIDNCIRCGRRLEVEP